MDALWWIWSVTWPLLIGGGMYAISGKCRGKNAKNFFRLSAWGFWLLYLTLIPGPFLLLGPLNIIIKLAPSVICFFLAVSSIIKEMRAQQQGEYTDVA